MSFVDSVIQALSVPEDALKTLNGAQSRDELAQHLFDLVAAVTDLARRVAVLEHPGATPAVVDLAVEVDALNQQIAIAQAVQKQQPTGEHAASVVLLQQQIAAAKASAPQAAATPADVSAVSAVVIELLAPAPSAAVSPAQQMVNAGG
jgi:hypothetical protein